jgi:hypothetical protein
MIGFSTVRGASPPGASLLTIVLLLVLFSPRLRAHDGPPFPILSDHPAGPYLISIWTDPDTTEDGSAGGQFWVRVYAAGESGTVPDATRAAVAIRPLSRPGSTLTATASPVRGDVTNQFAALVMDHEGPFAVHVTVEGPLGSASADAQVDATYDTRPAPILLVLYLMPFLLIGGLWGKVLLRRRLMVNSAAPRAARADGHHDAHDETTKR